MVYRKFIKQLFDFVLSLIAIIILSPLLIVLFIMVRIKLGEPVIFHQERPGKDGKIFTLYKFRSMTNEKDSQGKLLSSEKRLTGFGRRLRATSLDELPELFNILFGQMSIVGPRPLLVKYLERYNAEQKKRHNVKPGLTGLAQIKGRNSINWDEKLGYDVEYVNKCSFWLDLKILFGTLSVVFKRTGINNSDEIIMDDFYGDKGKDYYK